MAGGQVTEEAELGGAGLYCGRVDPEDLAVAVNALTPFATIPHRLWEHVAAAGGLARQVSGLSVAPALRRTRAARACAASTLLPRSPLVVR